MIKRLKKKDKNTEKPKQESVVIEVKDNMPQLVYGPPSFFRKKAGEITPEKNEVEGVYGPPVGTTFSESTIVFEKIPDPVYGPPSDFPEKPAEFQPEDNQVQEVYGPMPADEPMVPLREHEKLPEVIYGPPWVFGFDDDSGDGDDQC
ncbi:MAG: hypothetical protein IKG46_08225 [Solobacterium sp.]|nr:hypothetical protein [Solobacterium sp.]